MRSKFLKLRSKYLICLFSLSALVLGGEYPNITVEDFYGEWQLDKVIRTGRGSSFTEETIVEKFDYHIVIGETSFFTCNDLYLYEDLQWHIDTLSYGGSDCTFFTLRSNNLISSDVPMLELNSIKFGKKSGPYAFDISMPGFLASYYDSWFLFYKKIKTERHTDFANPLMNNILGEWEPYEFYYREDYFMTYDQFKSTYSRNIKFNKNTYTDYNGKGHDTIYEIHPLPSDAPSICAKHYPDSVRASFGVISKFVIFSEEGFVWDKFEVTGNGILADVTTTGAILYRKLPSP